MAAKIRIDSLTNKQREQINKDLHIKIEDKMTKRVSYIDPYTVDGDFVLLPFSYAFNTCRLNRPKVSKYPRTENIVFQGELREEQKVIKTEALENLNKYGTTLIACYPGFGKTSTSIYLSSIVKTKVLIVLNRLVLMDQWASAINKFCPQATVECLKPSKKNVNMEADFFIINAINVSKYSHEFFSFIGLVIVDEAHLIVSTVLHESLQYLTPSYLIGLSATPYRPDGLNILLDLYFSSNKIVRKLHRKHKVYKVNTGFEPEMECDRFGKVIWGKVLESQCSSQVRNEMIVKIVKTFADRNILILSKRIEQAQFLLTRLQEENVHVASLFGTQIEFDKTARVLIGTTGKLGVGFDHEKMDTLILASDLEEYFIQYLGRVFRRTDTEPIVFDLVDNNTILKRHFATRKKVYMEAGGTIHEMKI